MNPNEKQLFEAVEKAAKRLKKKGLSAKEQKDQVTEILYRHREEIERGDFTMAMFKIKSLK